MIQILKVFHFPIMVIIVMLIYAVRIRNDFGDESVIYWLSLLVCGWAIAELSRRIVQFRKVNKEDKK